MSKILETIDELNRGRNLVRAAYMAAHGAHGLDSAEMNAMACLLAAAEGSLHVVEAQLDTMKGIADSEQAGLKSSSSVG